MRILSGIEYYLFDIDGTSDKYSLDEYTRLEPGKSKLKVIISWFRFDEVSTWFANNRMIACTVHTEKMSGWSSDGKRVGAAQAGFGNFNGLIWRHIGLIHLKSVDRDILHEYAYAEMAKQVLADMERKLLGKT